MVFNSLPQCLTLWSKQKPVFLRDFHQGLESFIEQTSGVQSPLLIFSFGDPNEQTKQFLSKLFSPKIMGEYLLEGVVRTLSLNPPTEKEIEKILFSILDKEVHSLNIAQNKFMIQDIKIKANRDLRSAIQLLQFYSANRLQEQ